jgi:macrolide-specific efflux system membrane fusion protein
VDASKPQLIQRPEQPLALAGARTRQPRPWQNYLLALAVIGAIVAAYELVGPSTTKSTTEIRLVTVEQGVVQASESASGNLAPVSESDLNFKSSGILTGLYVQPGQKVQKGQLLAEIDPSAASVALQEADASLEAAQAKLAATEADPSGSSSIGGGSEGASASAAAFVGASGSSGASGASGPVGTTSPSVTQPATKKKATSSSTSTSTPDSAVTQAEDAANIASAEAAVSSAELTVKSDTNALAGTKLYAPSAGTIASISGAVGDEVTAGTGSSDTGSGGSDASSAFGAASTTSDASSSSSSTSGSGFIVLANLSAMQLVVSVSEADIGSIKAGQPATISIDALPNEEFAAKVTSISLLSTDTSGVISYSVTITLTQNSRQLLPGMTATATIITGQANDAVNVESAAITSAGSSSTVTVDTNGKMTVTPVITGLVGASTTQILAGVTPGEELAVPVATSIATSTTTTGSGTLGTGSGGFGGGGFTGGGGGGFARFGRGG